MAQRLIVWCCNRRVSLLFCYMSFAVSVAARCFFAFAAWIFPASVAVSECSVSPIGPAEMSIDFERSASWRALLRSPFAPIDSTTSRLVPEGLQLAALSYLFGCRERLQHSVWL